jgi:hypothetical protein
LRRQRPDARDVGYRSRATALAHCSSGSRRTAMAPATHEQDRYGASHKQSGRSAYEGLADE